MDAAAPAGPGRAKLTCANFAHAFAALPADDKSRIRNPAAPNIAIVIGLQRHALGAPALERYPEQIKRARARSARRRRSPAACRPCATASRRASRAWSCRCSRRDVIAMATAVALTPRRVRRRAAAGRLRQDRAGPADRRAALRPPADASSCRPGRCRSGISNTEKARVRELYAEGKVGRDELLDAESRPTTAPGTCTFYGTANSNQMLMEMMGLHLPGAAFVHPGHAAARRADRAAAVHAGSPRSARDGNAYRRSARWSTRRASSTRWSACWPPAARPTTRCTWRRWRAPPASLIDWEDFADLSPRRRR